LLAAYNDDTELFETTCVVGSGFTDESLKKVYDILKENTIEGPLDEYQVAGIQNSKNVRLFGGLSKIENGCVVQSRHGHGDQGH
jgi:ATP-dependent DNA ligase